MFLLRALLDKQVKIQETGPYGSRKLIYQCKTDQYNIDCRDFLTPITGTLKSNLEDNKLVY